ncbi:Crp/Fnr family transcriptional regulator [Flavihumibacter sp. UBA7668]|uniref:Crp/Fnr family transcriptional regulator n=1 Tax=Flavihumibacter sp. UBA7668 TaxID=1946542 RepID=UPI0025C55C66|nr:Crp/Fnr family transcriptional regulator [Flavihumibacter sp. UBA7668]
MQPETNPSKLSSANEADQELWAIQQSLLQSPYNLPEEKDFFAEKIEIRRVPKGEFLISQGQRLFCSYHLFKGCVREYYVKDGEEKTIAFYTAGDSLYDGGDKQNQEPSSVNWETVSECIVSVFTHEVEKEMYRLFPRLESLCRMETEKQYSRYKKSLHHYLDSSPEERYENLIETKPELFQLVPLYHIASYLGVTPESLSRIRRRMKLS